MPATITLVPESSEKITLCLKKEFTRFNGRNSVDVVYQDAAYEYILSGTEFSRPIENLDFRINDKSIEIEYKQSIENETVFVKGKTNQYVKPFSLMYGITDISIEIEYTDGKLIYLFSSYLVIAIAVHGERNMESVSDMLDDIYKKDHALLRKNRTINDYISPNQLKSSANKYAEEVASIKEIVNVLKSNSPFFRSNPHTKTVSNFQVDSFERLSRITPQSIQYIATHPEQLKQTFAPTGIVVNRQQMIPQKTLVNFQYFSSKTPENIAIVSFIESIRRRVEIRKQELQTSLAEGLGTVRPNQNIKKDYILSSTVIHKYTQLTFAGVLTELEVLCNQLSILLSEYKEIFSCEYSVLHQLPKPSPIFLEIYHYRKIYELMVKWFASGEFVVPTKENFLHFTSADTIYEYFCLLNMYDILLSLGFMEDDEKRKLYEYKCSDPRYMNTTGPNTFVFIRGNQEVTLYYQPVIYSSPESTTNNISLVRTDKSYWTPDFIIKKVSSGMTTYGILDSKWRSREAIKKGGVLQETVYKYLYSVADYNTQKSVQFLWLLQGKDDNSRTYFHNSSRASRMLSNSFQKSTGIVRLSPKTGIFELMQILREFLQ